MNIDNNQFEAIRKELLFDSPASFATTEKVVRDLIIPRVFSFCSSNPCLFGQEEVLLQDVYVHVRKKLVTQFFEGERAKSESILREAKYFSGWIHTIADNELKKRYRKAQKDYVHRVDIGEEELEGLPGTDGQSDPVRGLLAKEELNETFNMVLATDFSPHKILTWMEYYMNIYEWWMSSIGSIDMICATHSRATIDELYYRVLQKVDKHSWFKAHPLLLEKMEKKLEEKDEVWGTYGNKPLSETFGTRKPQSVISDWIYKINEAIRQEKTK